jgi:hypothetical protein
VLPVRTLAVTDGCARSTHVGDAERESFVAVLVLILQFVTFCHGRTTPVSVDPSVPLVVFALVNVSEIVIGINR